MNIIALLIGVVILSGIVYYVSRPLLKARRTAKPNAADALSLETQRDSLYTQIKELDLDHETGKVNAEDYTRVRAELVTQAAEVLKQLDGVVAEQGAVPHAMPIAPALAPDGDELEAMIAARRKTPPVTAPKSTEADLEAMIAAHRKTSAPAVTTVPDSASAFCPKCGKPVGVDDAFCAKCGATLQAVY